MRSCMRDEYSTAIRLCTRAEYSTDIRSCRRHEQCRPLTCASGQMWPTTKPWEPPEKRPSVSRATSWHGERHGGHKLRLRQCACTSNCTMPCQTVLYCRGHPWYLPTSRSALGRGLGGIHPGAFSGCPQHNHQSGKPWIPPLRSLLLVRLVYHGNTPRRRFSAEHIAPAPRCLTLPSPAPMMADVGVSISGIPGPPLGPSPLITTTHPCTTRHSTCKQYVQAVQYTWVQNEAVVSCFLAFQAHRRA